MKQLAKISAIAAISLIGFAACNNNAPGGSTAAADSTKTAQRLPLTLTKVSASPEFTGATLMLKSAKAEKAGADSAKVAFEFDVKNYDLKAQTADNATKSCANSKDGQHIHFILDNQPYKALYEPKNVVTLASNTEHTLLCFLSRSYHESLKNKEAAVIVHFKIDEKGNYKKLDEPKTPMLFYSRPKGDYLGKDTTNLLLDFYLANCTLSPDGYVVKAQIANETQKTDTTITISAWESNFVQNLGTGKCKVTLTLVDTKNPSAEKPTISREFNMAATEPMK